MIKSEILPTLFVSHGGGPWPFVEEMRKGFIKTEEALNNLPKTLPYKPKTILSISGHWESDDITVGTSANPPTEYDYSGFPEHTYHIKYKAPGSPIVAKRVSELLKAAGIKCKEDAEHGFDHGTFVPLYLMYPEAEIPVVSLSIKSNYNPAEHILIGEALSPLRQEGVLILGSGLTYHNLRMFGPSGSDASEEFEKWLTEVVIGTNAETRNQKLKEWEKAPLARVAHPREDHLIPLMIVAGAAGSDQGKLAFTDNFRGIKMASYRFG